MLDDIPLNVEVQFPPLDTPYRFQEANMGPDELNANFEALQQRLVLSAAPSAPWQALASTVGGSLYRVDLLVTQDVTLAHSRRRTPIMVFAYWALDSGLGRPLGVPQGGAPLIDGAIYNLRAWDLDTISLRTTKAGQYVVIIV